jgi:hypothetical protein
MSEVLEFPTAPLKPAPLYAYQDRGEDAYYTTKQSADFLTNRGYPVTWRYLTKISTPGEGLGPKPDRVFGGRHLYTGKTLVAWAESRCKPDEQGIKCTKE